MLAKNLHFCISCYDGDLSILKYAEDFTLYAKQGSSVNFSGLPHMEIPNVGYNIYAYLKFIVDNYDNLPEAVFFTKNNIFPRHMSENAFVRNLTERRPSFIDEDVLNYDYPFAYVSPNNQFYELNNNWYVRNCAPRYFGTFNNFLNHFFLIKDNPAYVSFPPGCNLIVSRKQILNRPRDFYLQLINTFDYTPLAPECFFIERAIDYIFSPSVMINPRYADEFTGSQKLGTLTHFFKSLCVKLAYR